MNIIKRCLLNLAAPVIFALCPTVMAGQVVGYVTDIHIHGNSWSTYNENDYGVMSLYVEGLPNACNNATWQKRVVITTNHPLFESAYSMALAAKLADRKVRINYLEKCTVRGAAWDFGYMGLE